MRKKRSEQQDSAPGGRVSPADVQQIEFRLAFRGYNERDVDAFLDKVTEDLAWYQEEIERLRAAPVAPAAVAAGDLGAAEAEAAAIVERAQRQADEIVRAAERRAAPAAVGGAASGEARAAVAPFLNVEREFLQRLGGLVQGHAEDIKEMVLALRARADLPPSPEAVDNGAEAPRSQPAAAADGASAAEIRERLGEPEPEPRPDAQPEPERVIDLATEPAYSSEGAPAGEGRERSLRELFWGDD